MVLSVPECVLPLAAELGEGPLWWQGALWFTDIKGLKVHRFAPQTGALKSWDAPAQVGFLAPLENGHFIAGAQTGLLDFDPARGAVLLTDAGRPFWATLGGFTNSTTGRGTMNALYRNKYPAQVDHSNPRWVTENGAPCLEFDGVGTYLELPREALPSKGAFTMSFDIKPTSNKDQSLLVNGAVGRQTGLSVQIRGGKLYATFRDADWKTITLDTQLAVPANQWSNITLRYYFNDLTLAVNGKTASTPATFPANNIGFTVIGGGWNQPWFAGRLRNLHIVHNAE